MARKIYSTISFPIILPTGTSAVDLVTGYVPGYRGKIAGWQFVTTVVATGASATQTLNLEINAIDVTDSATAILLADASAVGEVKALGAPTANNEFDENDTISIEVAASGTAFTAGAGTLYLLLEQSARGI